MTTATDFFDRARRVAAWGVIGSGGLALAGTFLDWVTIEPPPVLPEAQAAQAEPFSGIEVVPDGWVILLLGLGLLFCGAGLWATPRRALAWISFVAAMTIGGIAVARLREVGEISSGLSRRMDIVGDADPAAGLLLCAAAGVCGLLAAIVALVATPRATT